MDHLSESWTAASWMAADVATNGATPPDVVELALVPIIGGEIQELRTWLVRPPVGITRQATKSHGIRDSDVENAPTIDVVCDDVLNVLRSADVIVAHYVRLDIDVLSRVLYERMPSNMLDTLRVARAVCPNMPGYDLGALAEAFGLGVGLIGPANSAGYGAMVTARLFLRLVASVSADPTVSEILAINPVPPRLS